MRGFSRDLGSVQLWSVIMSNGGWNELPSQRPDKELTTNVQQMTLRVPEGAEN
jgi:hypothetical protein